MKINCALQYAWQLSPDTPPGPRISQDASEQGSTLRHLPQNAVNARGPRLSIPSKGWGLAIGRVGGSGKISVVSAGLLDGAWRGVVQCCGCGAVRFGAARRGVVHRRGALSRVLAGAASRQPSCAHVSCWRAPRSPSIRRMCISTRIPQAAYPFC